MASYGSPSNNRHENLFKSTCRDNRATSVAVKTTSPATPKRGQSHRALPPLPGSKTNTKKRTMPNKVKSDPKNEIKSPPVPAKPAKPTRAPRTNSSFKRAQSIAFASEALRISQNTGGETPVRMHSQEDLKSNLPPRLPVIKPTIPAKPPIVPSRKGVSPTLPAKPNLTTPPKLPPKPLVLSEEEHKQINEACKKFCNANKQLLAVSRSALAKAQSLSAAKIEFLNAQLGVAADDLRQFNAKYSDLIKEAGKAFDQKKTCNIACLTLDIANFSSIICAALKLAAVECESDESVFKPSLKSITTVRDSLIHVVDILKAVADKVDQSLVPQLEGHIKKTSTTLVGLVGHKTTGPLIPVGTRMEIEATIRASVLSIAKLVNSFNGPLEQSIVNEAKVASCCVAQMWATLTETVNTNTNLLSMPKVREIISDYAAELKQSFSSFMEKTKQQVANPSPNAFETMKENEKSLRNILHDIVAHIQAFSEIDTSERKNIDVNAIKPSPKNIEVADKILSNPAEIVPAPPQNIIQSSIDLPDDYVESTENIWDEPEEDEGRVLYADSGNLRCSTLNKLIIHTTANLDMNRMKTFITTYRSFTTSETLLAKLIQRYHVPSDANVDALPIQLRCCNSLKYLIETQHEEFSEDFTKTLNEFLGELNSQPAYKKFATIIQTTLEKKKDEKQTTKNEIINLTIEEKIPLSPAKLLFVIAEEEIARQLTLVDFRIYRAIKPIELLNQAWSKAKYRYRAKNVLALVARSTQLTLWVASTILWQETLRGRVRAYTKMVNIAQHMYTMNNFNSLMAVLAGINTAAVYRLKFTREQISDSTKQILEELGDLMDPTQSYGNYRQKLHDVDPPCVPFLGTYLTDITFIEDGNPDFIQGLINYRKRELVFSVIREIQQYQQQAYQDDFVNIAHFLTELASNDEEKLYDLSLIREPRGATIDQIL